MDGARRSAAPAIVDRRVALLIRIARRCSRRRAVVARACVIVVIARGRLGTPLFAILGGAAVLLFMQRRRHAGDDPHRNLLAQRLADAAGDSAVHARRIPARGRARVGAAAARVSRAGSAGFPAARPWSARCSARSSPSFTGGSGVTILALGGVLFPALLKDGYREQFSLGLLTASGSLGLLLPPALPLILYAVVAQIPIEDIFIGGILPGILLTVDDRGVGRARRHRLGRRRGSRSAPAEAVASMWAAKWELAMPAARARVAMFSGLATAVEAAALTALYALVVQAVVHRDLSIAPRPAARVRRVRDRDRRRAGHSRRRRRPDQLPGRRAGAGEAGRVGARAHRVAPRVPARAQRVPARSSAG